MASILQKLLRKTPTSRTITSFTHQSLSENFAISPFNRQSHLIDEINPHDPHTANLTPFFSPPKAEKPTSFQSSPTYPSFPFEFSVNPISSSGLVQSIPNDVESVGFRRSGGEPTLEELRLSHFVQIYPSFPFGYSANPIFSSGFLLAEHDDVVSDDSGMIWADSVKKKRKRKMNKHKYKKLRKSLRRKS